MAYGKSNDLAKRTQSDKVLRDKAFKIAKMLEFLNTKKFLLKDMLQICRKRFLLLVGLKIQFRGHMLLVT